MKPNEMAIPKNHARNFTGRDVKRFPHRGQNRALAATWFPHLQIMERDYLVLR
jgi:hypothetical protein